MIHDTLTEYMWLLSHVHTYMAYLCIECPVNVLCPLYPHTVGISLEQDSYDISESESSVEVCAVQNGDVPNISGNITVTLTTTSVSDSRAATGK